MASPSSYSVFVLLWLLSGLSPLVPCFGWESGLLNVHVVPHSHNDPGWWKTFEGYYQDWTKGILSSVVEILDEDPSRTFIWAEISYFQRWWEDQSESVKATVKRIVKNGQLEFVTAGWVMNDEANTHVVDIINQLTEGHEWLYKTLNFKPKFGWAIDPFGHSPTMPYVLQQMDFEAIVINRAHRQIKQSFRDSKHLEFFWNGDLLNSSSSFSMLTHMFPWKLYDIPNTCGPDWGVCATFDFERPEAIAITNNNVKERSEILVNMYKEKAKLFRHNSVLIPLGDDFKYKNPDITRKVMTQYEKLFEYINSDPSLAVNIKFSTLSHYFEDVKNSLQETGALTGSKANIDIGTPALSEHSLPFYQGDFFTYCDENEDYWSGYFTTRPFMKGLTRSTQAILRTGEILATLAQSYGGGDLNQEQWRKWFDSIQTARRNIALFQHHDGVTGTARRAVVEDYADRLLNSLAKVAEYSSDMALVVLSKPAADNNNRQSKQSDLSWVTEPARRIALATTRIIKIEEKAGAVVVIFNPLAHARSEVVSVLVDTFSLEVTDDKGETVTAQVDPVWDGNHPSATQFTLHFVSKVSGIGLATYFIRPSASHPAALSSVLVYSSHSSGSTSNIGDDWNYESKPLSHTNIITVENSLYKVALNGLGMIKSVTRRFSNNHNTGNGDTEHTVSIDQSFLTYNSRGGAYLFLPTGHAVPLELNTQAVRVIKGPVVVSVHSVHEDSIKEHILRLYQCNTATQKHQVTSCHQGQGIEIVHIVDLVKGDTELVTRYKTSIQNTGHFFTDSNGLDMRERKYDKNLPIQGNYYPITAAAYIESHSVPVLSESGSSYLSRFTILSHQAHGVTSLNEGELELMLDRRLNRDDARGLGEPITDNVRTSIPLWLVLETSTSSFKKDHAFFQPAISSVANDVWHIYNYPMHTLYSLLDATAPSSSLQEAWGHDHLLCVDPIAPAQISEQVQILSLAPRDAQSTQTILRFFYPPVTHFYLHTDQPQLGAPAPVYASPLSIFKHFTVTNSTEVALSLLNTKTKSSQNKSSIGPTEIKTWIINLSPVSIKIKEELAKTVNLPDTNLNGLTDLNQAIGTIQDIKSENNNVHDGKLNGDNRDETVMEKNEEKDTIYSEAATADDIEVINVQQPKDTINQEKYTGQSIAEKTKNKGDNQVGDNTDKVKNQVVKVSKTTNLYTISIIFYLGLLVIVVLGGWLLGSRRTQLKNENKHFSTSETSHTNLWKEREDSMMKLL